MQVSVEECACGSLFGERMSSLLGQRGTQEMSHRLLPQTSERISGIINKKISKKLVYSDSTWVIW